MAAGFLKDFDFVAGAKDIDGSFVDGEVGIGKFWFVGDAGDDDNGGAAFFSELKEVIPMGGGMGFAEVDIEGKEVESIDAEGGISFSGGVDDLDDGNSGNLFD